MRSNGFDRIGWIYDRLARLVFGRSITESQTCFLQDIPERSTILIVGGGTGWLVKEIFNRKPLCEIWYVEASLKMVELAKKKIGEHAKIHFIHGTEDQIPDSIPFDAVITNFFLDLFADEKLGSVIFKVRRVLRNNGLWFVTDFRRAEKWWQSFLLVIMYRFFRLICNVDAYTLPRWKESLMEAGLEQEKGRFFYSEFIESAVYRRLN